MTNLANLLRAVFHQQAIDVARRCSLGKDVPDMSRWNEITANAIRHSALQIWQQSMVQTATRIAAKKPNRRETLSAEPHLHGDTDMRSYRPGAESTFGASTKKQLWNPLGQTVSKVLIQGHNGLRLKRLGKHIEAKFDIHNPRVKDAVDQHIFTLCEETLDTATTDLETAMKKLRSLMRLGMSKSEATELLAKKIKRIFADPYRAYRIAATEEARITNAAQIMAAKDSGVVRAMMWNASVGSCEGCLLLSGKEVKIGQPFKVRGSGPWAKRGFKITYHPPLHPFCNCFMSEVM